MDKFIFRVCAFNPAGDVFATVDQRGTIYTFDLAHNSYTLVKRTGETLAVCVCVCVSVCEYSWKRLWYLRSHTYSHFSLF
jgi:hypothetical protein